MPNKQKTVEKKKMTTKQCPNCGMPRDEWPDPSGYTKQNKTYCCEGCAQDTGCTCD